MSLNYNYYFAAILTHGRQFMKGSTFASMFRCKYNKNPKLINHSLFRFLFLDGKYDTVMFEV